MRLRAWLRVNGVEPLAFARAIGLRYPKSVYRYLDLPPRRIPRTEIMLEIVRHTRGQVTANDFYAPPGTGEGLEQSA